MTSIQSIIDDVAFVSDRDLNAFTAQGHVLCGLVRRALDQARQTDAMRGEVTMTTVTGTLVTVSVSRVTGQQGWFVWAEAK